MTDLSSIECSPQGVPVWTSAVGADYDIEAVIGEPGWGFTVAHGGLLNIVFAEGNARLCAVVDGGTYPWQVRQVLAAGSTAFGLVFQKKNAP